VDKSAGIKEVEKSDKAAIKDGLVEIDRQSERFNRSKAISCTEMLLKPSLRKPKKCSNTL
jgi:hypothetical protein